MVSDLARSGAAWRRQLLAWFDNSAGVAADEPDRIDWVRVVPFVGLHAAALAAPWTGVSAVAIATAVGLYAAAHVRDHGVLPPLLLAPRVQDVARWRSSCSRCSARRPCSAARCGGPRTTATTTRTPTSTTTRTRALHHGFLWSHMGWFLSRANFAPRGALVTGWRAFPS